MHSPPPTRTLIIVSANRRTRAGRRQATTNRTPLSTLVRLGGEQMVAVAVRTHPTISDSSESILVMMSESESVVPV
jgi:hypothetical protein